MTWRRARVAVDRTHHVVDGDPLYADRFDEVLSFHEPGLAPVRRRDEAWHIDARARPAYDRRFLRTFGFYEGRAAVASADGWHHIVADGSDLCGERHAWCGNYQNDRCTIRDHGGRYYHLNPDGRAAYAQRWQYAGDFREGVAVVQADDGRCTHIDEDGAIVHARWFLDLDVFHKGLARARDARGWMHITRSGEPAYGRRFLMVEPFYNGFARVENIDGVREVIDVSAEAVLVMSVTPTARAAP